MRKTINYIILNILSIVSCVFSQNSDRLFLAGSITEYNRSLTKQYLNRQLFDEPYDGKMYLHALSGGYIYEVTAVTDVKWHRIVYGVLKFNSSGSYVSNSAKIWAKGGLGSGNLQFNSPKGIEVCYDDANSMDLYVADSGNNRVVKLKINLSDGSIVSQNYFYATTNGGFNNPIDVAVDTKDNQNPSDDELWIVDSNNHRVVQMSAVNGSVIRTFGSYGQGTNQFRNPTCITQQKSDWEKRAFFVSDNGNNRICRFFNLGSSIGVFSSYTLPYQTNITDLESDQTGYCFYAVDKLRHKIYKLLYNSLIICGEYGRYGFGENQLYFPKSIHLPRTIPNSSGGVWGAVKVQF